MGCHLKSFFKKLIIFKMECHLMSFSFYVSRTEIFVLFFKYKFIYFNWRLVTLQYCICFAIHQHESTMGVHVFPILKPLPPPSPCHPSGSSQCTSPKHPVSCIEPGLAIRFLYDIMHVSMPFSQIIPRLSHRVQIQHSNSCFF